MKPETWIAVYAAIVATAAFALNFRTWFEKQVRLDLTLMPDAVLIGGLGDDEKELMAVTVVNLGGRTTTLTHLVVLRFDNTWKRWRIRPSKSFFIPNPQAGGTGAIPFALDVGTKWTGIIRKRPDVIADVQDGTYYVGVYGTHQDRPHLIKIPKPRSKLPPNAKPLG
ncbi:MULTISPECIES: hypothetical protein [unclassified Bradyrhizobium]|uniref:hypothetical protein n=1 Tax=unclassified Bradyrhizobium TaxID=2631580 RepID=UPI001FF95FD7|nr:MULTISPECIES: hypothetical protein [unclassified Bradyrhizobium]MCK1708576.1 hypothetical protein [Bradyrhizobium sp. 143]MCK1731183.1 hypothetical protein [Bradyrhizobium sp. 142]